MNTGVITLALVARECERIRKEEDANMNRARSKVKKVSVEGRINNVAVRANIMTGQYQSLHIEATASVQDGENPSEIIDELKLFVAAELKRARDGGPARKREPEEMGFGELLKSR